MDLILKFFTVLGTNVIIVKTKSSYLFSMKSELSDEVVQ